MRSSTGEVSLGHLSGGNEGRASTAFSLFPSRFILLVQELNWLLSGQMLASLGENLCFLEVKVPVMNHKSIHCSAKLVSG